jgi:hypothetical protein
MKLLLVNLVLTIDSMGLNEREQGNPFEWAGHWGDSGHWREGFHLTSYLYK